MMRAREIAFWAIVAATAGVYATMLAWSIPAVSAEAGGRAIFDMRPGGYTFAEAKDFLAALTETGERIYRTIQLRLDIAYPALLAATVAWSILRLAPSSWGRTRLVLAAFAIPPMVFDYAENAMITRMLDAGADGVTAPMVRAASLFSRTKAASSTVALTILVALLLFWAVRRWRSAAKRA